MNQAPITDVAIIGAGPAGSIAAALLRQRGHSVVIIEQAHFPRFSIGESLLPQCMEYIEEAGMLNAVSDAGFQYKNGAAFVRNGKRTFFDFREKFSAGPGTTFQVQRAEFDHVLAKQAQAAGAEIRFGHRIEQMEYDVDQNPRLHIKSDTGEISQLTSRYVLDASGFGRVLPRLLDLETPSSMPTRSSVFTHIEDNIHTASEDTSAVANYDRDKILIAIHPELPDVWYWLIPFNNGRCSLGCVAEQAYFAEGLSPEMLLKDAVAACPELAELLRNAVYDTPVNKISGYSCNVKSLWGDKFALLGNAGEFLDPVFSSGVTIAMKSASLAAPLVSKQLAGEAVDWEAEYAVPLRLGVDTFRTYVNAWYDGDFQTVVFAENPQPEIKGMIASILAGYAWDTKNPYVKESRRRLKTLVALCEQM
jgi:flavin-dependent dehydrogenase